jgi:hypothetical protein
VAYVFGITVVVEMETGSGVVVAVEVGVVVVVVIVAVGDCGETRIQHRIPRLRARAPSTPTCNGAGVSLFFISMCMILESMYSVPENGMKRSNPESGVAVAGLAGLAAASVIF